MDLTVRERVTDAIRYWEPRRFVFNGVLAVIVLLYFFLSWPTAKRAISFDVVLLVFVLAVLANVAYCTAYIVDVFAQASGYRELWQKYRIILFGLGTMFAAVLTRWFSLGLFSTR